MKYWISLRKISGGAFVDDIELGPARYLRIPDGEVPLPQHQIPLTQWVKEIIGTFAPDPQDPAKGPTGDILFFVHGYNDTIADVDQRHELIQAALTPNTFPCRVISFDWPCGTTALGYLQDRDHARITSVRLVSAGIRLFVRSQTQKCAIRVHALGHSTGAFVIDPGGVRSCR